MLEKLLIFAFKLLMYRVYRKRYALPNDFKFNGYFIRLSGEGLIEAGRGCYISYFSYLSVERGSKIEMGDHVSIGHNVKIYTSGFSTRRYIEEGIEEKFVADVKIGSKVLIGSNTFICPGVEIVSNVVVGANSVVSCSLLKSGVYAGAPAKLIREYSRGV